MKELAALVGAILLAIAILIGLAWAGLWLNRPMAKYAKETDRQVYENSVAHQDGANAGIAIDCVNMQNSGLSAAERHVYASLVVETAASYGGNRTLSARSNACVSKAQSIIDGDMN